jgi:hypothetical protein
MDLLVDSSARIDVENFVYSPQSVDHSPDDYGPTEWANNLFFSDVEWGDLGYSSIVFDTVPLLKDSLLCDELSLDSFMEEEEDQLMLPTLETHGLPTRPLSAQDIKVGVGYPDPIPVQVLRVVNDFAGLLPPADALQVRRDLLHGVYRQIAAGVFIPGRSRVVAGPEILRDMGNNPHPFLGAGFDSNSSVIPVVFPGRAVVFNCKDQTGLVSQVVVVTAPYYF